MAILQGETGRWFNSMSQKARVEPDSLAVPLMRDIFTHIYSGLFTLFPEA